MALRFSVVVLLCVVCLAVSAKAQTSAQPPATSTQKPAPATQKPGTAPPAGTATAPEGYTSSQNRLERVSATHYRFTGQVEIEFQRGSKFFADGADYHSDTHILTAAGNVVVTSAEGRISAERIEFNTQSQTGTFYDATGIMSLGMTAERVQFGNQDPDVYFYGETVEKLGPKKYRITKGAFTTCVQPTPRWELISGSLTLNLDDYALLKNTVLRVKGVPIFYLPMAYYPLQDDERATGFLLPTYGTSSLRGQAISNAFFWAINRSQDATLFHDWFTRTGQGYGGEYRYVTNAQSSGNFRMYRFDQKQAEFTSNGSTSVLPATQSFEIRTDAVQTLAKGVRARSRVDYFSNITTQQLYHQNIYDASQRRRVVQGAVTGAWGPYSTGITYDQSAAFSDEHQAFVYGSTPRVNGAIAPTRLLGSSVYGSVTGEFANLPYHTEIDGETVASSDRGLTRYDVSPLVRVPFSRWTFLTLNTSAAYRLTRFSESIADVTQNVQVPEPFTRSYFDIRADAVGPVFTKIWDAPSDSRAERYKHVIEPTFGYQQTTPIEDYQRTPILSNNSDFVVGSAGRVTYGLTNRLLRRDKPREGTPSGAREFLSIALQQTYYSEPDASRFDPNYSTSTASRNPVDLSPVALNVRYSPTMSTTASLRAEHDVSGRGLLSLSTSGSMYVGRQSANVTLSRFTSGTTGSSAQTTLTGGTTLSFLEGRMSGNYAITWDITRSYIVSQTMSTTYFAQCCGFGVEFQNFNYAQFSTSSPLPADRRLNFSFTLAGLGTFSNFFGAFGGNSVR
jgi:LPS-assembly protein